MRGDGGAPQTGWLLVTWGRDTCLLTGAAGGGGPREDCELGYPGLDSEELCLNATRMLAGAAAGGWEERDGAWWGPRLERVVDRTRERGGKPSDAGHDGGASLPTRPPPAPILPLNVPS